MAADLAGELHTLSRGRGVMEADLARRVGPQLRALLLVDPQTSQAELRQHLIASLDQAAADLPDDLRLAFAAGLALFPYLRSRYPAEVMPSGRFLKDRLNWAAKKLGRGDDTARDYLGYAIDAAAAALSEASLRPGAHSAGPPDDHGAGYPLRDWHLARLQVTVSLDGPRPTALEQRTVVADVDGLDEVVISTAIPQPTEAMPAASHVDLSVCTAGCSLVRVHWPSPTYLQYFVRLPRPLRRGDAQQVEVELSMPADQPFSPLYVFTPLLRCDDFELRIKLGSRAANTRVWRIDGLSPGMAHDFADPAELIEIGLSNEVHLMYPRPRIGLAYGARWSN